MALLWVSHGRAMSGLAGKTIPLRSRPQHVAHHMHCVLRSICAGPARVGFTEELSR